MEYLHEISENNELDRVSCPPQRLITTSERAQVTEINKCFLFGLGIVLFQQVLAAPAPTLQQIPPIIPLKQNLMAVDYFRDGRQSGCGLRVTGEAEENLWLNVLVSVFEKENGLVFGIFKVSAKKLKEGVPQSPEGRKNYTSIGKIHHAWLRTSSGLQPELIKNGQMLHVDGYMASMEFSSGMQLLAAIPGSSFRVGISRKEEDPEEIYEFNNRISSPEAGKLFECMRNLRDAIEEKKDRQHL